jgi:hypothetical protein
MWAITCKKKDKPEYKIFVNKTVKQNNNKRLENQKQAEKQNTQT